MSISKTISFFVFVFVAMSSCSNDIIINDPEFKKALLGANVDKNKDGVIQTDEAELLDKLVLNSRKISDMSGIEHFVNLKELSCSNNKLTALDVSGILKLERLNCYNNKIEKLTLPQNGALKFLNCKNNKLSNIDVSKVDSLVDLGISRNMLTKLDVSGLEYLESLDCKKNELESLLIKGCEKLIRVDCEKNKIQKLNCKGLPKLTYLFCNQNNLSEVVFEGNSSLLSFRCANNQIKSLDLSNCPAIEKIYCNDNSLVELELTGCGNLESLFCFNNLLPKLGLQDLNQLAFVKCNNNKLTELDFSQSLQLNMLDCSENNLEGLDLSNNFRLNRILCAKNRDLTKVYVNDLDLLQRPRFAFVADSAVSVDIKKNEPIALIDNKVADWASEFTVGKDGGVFDAEISRSLPTLQWKHRIYTSHFVSPVVYKGYVVYMSRDCRMIVLDYKTGNVKYVTKRLGLDCLSSPVVDDGVVYVTTVDKVCAINLLNGEVKWEMSVGSDRISSVPFVEGDFVLVAGFDKVYCINKNTGVKKWHYFMSTIIYDGKQFRNSLTLRRSASPVVKDGKVIVGNSFEPLLYCIDLESGNLLWRFENKASFYPRPLVHDGIVYIGDDIGVFHAVDFNTGVEKWDIPLYNLPDLEFATENEEFRKYIYMGYEGNTRMRKILSPALFIPESNTLIVGNEYAMLLAIDITTKKVEVLKSEKRIAPYITSGVLLKDDLMLFNNTDSHVDLYDVKMKETVWSIELYDRLETAVGVYDGRLYFCDKSGCLFCYK